eukprot:1136665-Pelagomonas_calceolata.AAC.1
MAVVSTLRKNKACFQYRGVWRLVYGHNKQNGHGKLIAANLAGLHAAAVLPPTVVQPCVFTIFDFKQVQCPWFAFRGEEEESGIAMEVVSCSDPGRKG